MRRRVLIPALTLAAVAIYAAEFVLQDKLQRHEPFPESRLQINPPTFRWPAASGTLSYRVELARSRTFEAPQVAVVSESFHRPLQPLETGTWFWRYRAERPVTGVWSKAESFAITDDLARWPVPEWRQLAARIPTGHPRIYLRAEDRNRIQTNVRTLGAEWERWKSHTRHSVEQPYSLDTYKQRVPAGSSARAKKELIWAAKAAGVDVAHPIADLAWIWIATGDRWFLNAAKQRAMLAASLDPQGFVSEKNSDFGNSAIVNGLALAYDLLYDELSASERGVIRGSITARCRPIFETLAGASQNLMRAHNWQHVFLDGLMGAIAIHGEEPAADAWVDLGLRSFVALYPWFGGNDGGSQEGLRYYHATEMIPSLNVRDLFHNVFGLQLEDGNPWFRANPYYLLYAFPPGSVKARLGDSTIGTSGEDDEDDAPYPGGRAQLAALRMATLYGNGHAASYANSIAAAAPNLKHPIAESLRWGLSTTAKPESLTTLPAARLFRDIGAVFTHSDYTHPDRNVRLVFHSSPYGALGHAHADQNSFHIIAANEDLLIDSGYYTPAGDPHRQQWSLQTKAHNTILINGEGQSYGDTRGHGQVRHFVQNDDWVYMVGSAKTAYPSTPLQRFDRHIVWLKGKAVQTFVVVDDIAAAIGGATPRFDWLLHATDRMQVNDADRQITVRTKKSEALVTFTAPDQLRFEQTDQFDVPAVFWRKGKNFPLPNQWHLKATPSLAAARQTFVAVIQVSGRGAAKPEIQQLTDGGLATAGFRVQHDPGSRLLRIERIPASQ